MLTNILVSEQSSLVSQRCVATIPLRSAEATWELIVGQVRALLDLRLFPAAGRVEETLHHLRPLARYLLIMHALEAGSVVLDTGDLRLVFIFAYGQNLCDEDLSLPPVEVLGEMPAESLLSLTFFVVRAVDDPLLLDLVQKANEDKALSVRVEACPPVEAPDDLGPEGEGSGETQKGV